MQQVALNVFSSGAKWGPGIIDPAATGAGPGPWILLANHGSAAITVAFSGHSMGDQTVEIFLPPGQVVLSIAGGQTQSVQLTVPPNTALNARFVVGGRSGKLAWVAR